MKFRIAILAGLGLAAVVSSAAVAQVQAQATASATIVAPATVASTRALAFGTIAKPTTGSNTVTVASAASGSATPTLTGAGNGFVPTANQASAATFHLVGTAGETYSITTSTLSFTNQTNNLSNVGPETPVAASGTLNTLPGNGTDDLFIGGHFDISPTTTVQTYNGTLNITVTFN